MHTLYCTRRSKRPRSREHTLRTAHRRIPASVHSAPRTRTFHLCSSSPSWAIFVLHLRSLQGAYRFGYKHFTLAPQSKSRAPGQAAPDWQGWQSSPIKKKPTASHRLVKLMNEWLSRSTEIKPIWTSDKVGDRRRSSVAMMTCAYPPSAVVCKRVKVDERRAVQDRSKHKMAHLAQTRCCKSDGAVHVLEFQQTRQFQIWILPEIGFFHRAV